MLITLLVALGCEEEDRPSMFKLAILRVPTTMMMARPSTSPLHFAWLPLVVVEGEVVVVVVEEEEEEMVVVVVVRRGGGEGTHPWKYFISSDFSPPSPFDSNRCWSFCPHRVT